MELGKFSKFVMHEIVQFVPNDKWGGCIGYISEVKPVDGDIRYMVAVPVLPRDGEQPGGTAYRFSMESANEFESAVVVHDKGKGDTFPYAFVPPFLPMVEMEEEAANQTEEAQTEQQESPAE